MPKTTAALGTFFLAMTLFPSVFQRAREELDNVIGIGRLPAFADRPNLPYFDALIKETLRWKNVGPISQQFLIYIYNISIADLRSPTSL